MLTKHTGVESGVLVELKVATVYGKVGPALGANLSGLGGVGQIGPSEHAAPLPNLLNLGSKMDPESGYAIAI